MLEHEKITEQKQPERGLEEYMTNMMGTYQITYCSSEGADTNYFQNWPVFEQGFASVKRNFDV